MASNGSQRLPTAPYDYKHTLLLAPIDSHLLPPRELTPQPNSQDQENLELKVRLKKIEENKAAITRKRSVNLAEQEQKTAEMKLKKLEDEKADEMVLTKKQRSVPSLPTHQHENYGSHQPSHQPTPTTGPPQRPYLSPSHLKTKA